MNITARSYSFGKFRDSGPHSSVISSQDIKLLVDCLLSMLMCAGWLPEWQGTAKGWGRVTPLQYEELSHSCPEYITTDMHIMMYNWYSQTMANMLSSVYMTKNVTLESVISISG
jgi:hypothetical protein